MRATGGGGGDEPMTGLESIRQSGGWRDGANRAVGARVQFGVCWLAIVGMAAG